MLSVKRYSSTLLVAMAATFGVVREASAKPEVEVCLEAYDRGQALREGRKLIEARKELLTCGRDVCPAALRKDCASWIEEVDRSLGSIVFRVVDAQGHDLTRAEISIDGETVVKRVDGWAVAVEPGRHEVRAVVAGYPILEQKVVVAEGEKNRTVVFRLPDPARVEPPRAAPPSDQASSEPHGEGVPAAVWITGGASIVAFGAFAYFGITGTSELSKLQDECGVTRACSKREVDDVKTTLVVGDVAAAVGVVAVGLFTYFLVDHLSSRSAPRSPRATATIAF